MSTSASTLRHAPVATEEEEVAPGVRLIFAPGHTPGHMCVDVTSGLEMAIYTGDLRSRDAAYHQGTVWAWLVGPFIDAWLKVHPQDKPTARAFLDRFPESMNENGIGTISEVFDAREPHTAGGCIAQAWSVAEVLRCWVKTA